MARQTKAEIEAELERIQAEKDRADAENSELRKRLLETEDRIPGPLQADAEPRKEPEYEERRGCSPIVIMTGMMFMMFLVMLVGAVAATAWYFSQGGGDDTRPDPDRSRSALVKEIEGAMDGPEAEHHALYLSKVCRGVADRLTDDFKQESPVFDQRQEAADLFGIVGQFATTVEGVNTYRDLPNVITGVQESVFGTELKGGAIEPADETALVRAWNDLADAFAEVAK